MKTKIVKGLTLVIFISLIAGFIAYKAGYFDQEKTSIEKNKEPNSSVKVPVPKKQTDTLKKVEIMSSSKSMIIKDPVIESDTTNSIPVPKFYYDVMSSSKSGYILHPGDIEKLTRDTTFIDSLLWELSE